MQISCVLLLYRIDVSMDALEIIHISFWLELDTNDMVT